MKKYRYIFATIGLILGAVVGYGVGWLVFFGLFSLFELLGFEGFGGEGIMAYLSFLFGFLPIIIVYGFPIIGAIRGWRCGYKIGKKKDDASSLA